MKLTDFSKLKIAVFELGASPVVADIDKSLTGEGISVSEAHENIVVGDRGIYYVDKRGIVTRITVHIVDKDISSRYANNIKIYIEEDDFDNEALVKNIHRFHLVRCKTIERAEREGWRDKYKMSRSSNGKFFYRYLRNNTVYRESDSQRLNVCKNCLDVVNGFSKEPFYVKTFDIVKFLSSEINISKFLNKKGEYDDVCVPNLYKSDWGEISRKYRKLIGYKCESPSCPSPDLNSDGLHRYLHTHHISQDKTNNNYHNLKALCVYCHANQPNHSQLLNSPDYKEYISLRGIKAAV